VLRAGGEGSAVTVAAFYAEWTTDPEWVRRRGESTNLHNWERTRKFVERYGDRSMRSIDDAVVVKWLRGGKRTGTVPALRLFFNDAIRPRPGAWLCSTRSPSSASSEARGAAISSRRLTPRA
jgi:hypothetical protein